MKKMMMKMKRKRSYILPVILISMVIIYFYLGVFFESGVDYYDHFLKEEKATTENQITQYKGKTADQTVVIRSSVMNQTDRLVEVSIGDTVKEYVIESTEDCTKVRLFDSDNTLVLESTINKNIETITTAMGTELSYATYRPIEGELYNESNPDPIMLIIIANKLAEVSRGDFPMLMFAALIYGTFLVDLLFPNFFLRFKSLTFSGRVEMPKYYRQMQKISWVVVPIFLVVILLNALN